MKDSSSLHISSLNNKSLPPRSARRTRKPLQEPWVKSPGSGIWLRCTYTKCSHEWRYFGRRQWAECPICHTAMKVAVAKRNFLSENNTEKEFRA
jgi:hypothetical protein